MLTKSRNEQVSGDPEPGYADTTNHVNAPIDGVAPLRFAVMCSGDRLEDWQARCIHHLRVLEAVELAAVIIRADPDGGSTQDGARFSLWNWSYGRYARKHSYSKRPIELSDIDPGLHRLVCHPLKERDGRERLSDADVMKIRAWDLDFVLKFGFGALQGDIMSVARYGIWTFRHEYAETSYGTPPYFWELCVREGLVVAALERLTDGSDERIILQSGVLRPVWHSYTRTLDAVLYRVLEWPARVCKDLRNGNGQYVDGPPASSVALPRKRPSNVDSLRFALLRARSFCTHVYRIAFRAQWWNVGIVDAPIQTFLSPGARPPVRWLPEMRSGRFIADPFGLNQRGKLVVLVEEFEQQRNRGWISALEVTRAGEISPPQAVLTIASHAAHPYIVEHRSGVYCVLDTPALREVSLYKAGSFPFSWQKVCTLVEDFGAADPTIFRHAGRWWLLCTGHDSGKGSTPRKSYITGLYTTLYAWHADNLFGPWMPHMANPLKVDVRSSRPGGTPFVHQGQLYRPAQDCSQRYGGAITINRVLTLTPTEFHEEPVTIIQPYARYKHGLHTLSSIGNVTVIDGQREMRSYQFLRARIGQMSLALRSR